MKEKIKGIFLNTKDVEKSAYAWNTTSGLMFAMQSAVMLIVITRTNGLEDAGVFSIAYAIGSLMSFIGEYGVRKYQVSDIKEKVSFTDYHSHRVFTCVIMLLVFVVYVGAGYLRGQYSPSKFWVIIFVCLLKLVEAYADVYYSRYQQLRRLDVAAKTNTFRIGLAMLACMISLAITHDLLISVIIWFIVALITMVLSSMLVASEFGGIHFRINKEALITLTKECFPLFVGSFLLLYVGNAPKYAIDAVLDDTAQACYNFIFMPVFVIGLLANFVFNPILVKLAYKWDRGEIKVFTKVVVRQIGVIAAITLLAISVALTIGCPVLGWLYNVDLHEYRTHLTILMVGGGMLALANFFTVVVTVVRGQKHLMVGYVAIALVAKILSHHFVSLYGIMGAVELYTGLMTLLALVFAFVLVLCVKKRKK